MIKGDANRRLLQNCWGDIHTIDTLINGSPHVIVAFSHFRSGNESLTA